MNATDAIRNDLAMSQRIIDAYIGDLEDSDLLVRPLPEMNHIAWQLGHLIGSERNIVEMIKPGSCPPLPDDFNEGHGRKTYDVDDPSKFYTKSRYQELWKTQREATLAVLQSLTEEDLDRTDDKFPAMAPSVGRLMGMCGTHPLMHAGQFVAVRRKLGKPVTI